MGVAVVSVGETVLYLTGGLFLLLCVEGAFPKALGIPHDLVAAIRWICVGLTVVGRYRRTPPTDGTGVKRHFPTGTPSRNWTPWMGGSAHLSSGAAAPTRTN